MISANYPGVRALTEAKYNASDEVKEIKEGRKIEGDQGRLKFDKDKAI